MKINRRDFIKTGGMVMLGSLAAPSFLGSCTGNGTDQATGISFAQNHFGVSESDMKKVLAAALEKGGDYADLFFEHSYRNNIGLQDGAVNRASSNIDFGMGVRVLAGDQTGYAYVENVTLDEMLKAARTAARIATGSAGKAPAALTEEPILNNYYGVQTPWDELAVNAKTPYLQKLNDQIFALDKRVHKVMASLGDTTSHILFCNSEGQMYYDYRPMVTLGAVCIMEDNGKIENSYASRAFRMGAEFLTDDIIAEVAKEAVEKTSILFQAIKPKGGEMPVVMGAGGSGILLHEAIGHAFEADFNRKNTSIFSDQLNKKVCNEHINVVDDGTIPFNRGFCQHRRRRYRRTEDLYREGRHPDQLLARPYQRQALWYSVNGQRPPRVIPPDADPAYARYLHGSRKRDGRRNDLDREKRYLCLQLYQWTGTDRCGRFHLLRERRLPD